MVFTPLMFKIDVRVESCENLPERLLKIYDLALAFYEQNEYKERQADSKEADCLPPMEHALVQSA